MVESVVESDGVQTNNEFRKLYIKKYSKVIGRKTVESRYWRKFKNPILAKEYAPIQSIEFNPISPHDMAVTSSARVQVYSATTHSVKKTISRFKDVVYCANYREDGKMMAAGDGTGLIQLFDANSRSILRTMRGHQGPVRVTRFLPNNTTQLMSASDDKTVRLWDVPGEAIVATYQGHTDYIRSGLVHKENPHLLFTGSYDHCVKLWDTRTANCCLTLNHGHPVEDILLFPGGSLVASAGGNQLKVWDILGGGSLLQTLSNHQKTITTMTLDGSGSRLLTGSLDHHVKVYNTQDFKVTHSIKYPAPILSLGLSPDDTHLCVGMANGLLSIRQRIVKTQDIAQSMAKKEELRGGTYKYFMRGHQHKCDANQDIWVESTRRKALKSYDRYLKKFQYKNAMDAVLLNNQPPNVVASLLEELIHRDSLHVALANRDDLSLEPICKFLMKHISNPRYCRLLVHVATVVLDMYAPVIGQSVLIDELFSKIKEKVEKEISLQQTLNEVMGLMDALFASSSLRKSI